MDSAKHNYMPLLPIPPLHFMFLLKYDFVAYPTNSNPTLIVYVERVLAVAHGRKGSINIVVLNSTRLFGFLFTD